MRPAGRRQRLRACAGAPAAAARCLARNGAPPLSAPLRRDGSDAAAQPEEEEISLEELGLGGGADREEL